jgi:hypothetical protein
VFPRGRQLLRAAVWWLGICLVMTGCAGLAGEPRIVRTLVPITPEVIMFPDAPPDLMLGAQIYAEHCTDCHGLNGAGDGFLIGNGPNQIANAPRSFLQAETAVTQTPLDWYFTITNGRIEQLMPPWRNSLSDEELWAVSYYTYLLHYDAGAAIRGEELINAAALDILVPDAEAIAQINDVDLISRLGIPEAVISGWNYDQRQDVTVYLRSLTVRGELGQGQRLAQPVTTPEIVENTITVTGTITNGSAGGNLPDRLEVTLYRFESNGSSDSWSTQSDSMGIYSISDLPLVPGDQVYALADYGDRPYSSEIVTLGANTSSIDIPITIFETTADPTALQIAGWVIQVGADAGVLQVNQVIRLLNNGDRAYWTDTVAATGRFASLSIPVPANAQILSADITNPRYVIAADGQAILDTSPVLPQREHLINISYSLPYAGQASIDQIVPIRFEGPLRVLAISETGVISDTLIRLGEQEIGGNIYQVYGTEMREANDSRFSFTVHGAAVASSTSVIPAIFIIAGSILVTAVIGYRVYRRMTAQSTQELLLDGLVRQIAELDAAYQSQQIEQDIYDIRRQRLKDRLSKLMDKE